MPVWLELTLTQARRVPISKRRAPSAPDVIVEWQHCQFARHAQEPRLTQLGMSLSCSAFPYGREEWSDESANKKAGAGRAPALARITTRRWVAPDGPERFFPPRLAARRSLDNYFWMLA